MTRAFLLLSFCSLAVAQPAPSDWRFAHPNADLKVAINVHALLMADPVAKAIEQYKAQPNANPAQVDFVMAVLRTIDRVAMSARQQGPNDTDALVLMTGSFDPALITAFFPKTGKSQAKAVGPHALLIGEGDSFSAAVTRMSGPVDPANADADPDPSDIWVEAKAAFIAKQSNQDLPPMFQGLKTVAVGLKVADSPELNVVLGAADNDGASGLLGMVKLLTSQLAVATPAATSAMKALTFQQDGSKVKLHYVIPPEALAALQQQAASAQLPAQLPTQLAPFLTALGVGAAAQPKVGAAAQPQNDGKIVIHGLDGGPKEVPASK